MPALRKPQHSTQQKKTPINSEAFPALSSTSAPVATPQWITVKSKDKQKPAKPEPPPQPKAPSFNPVADFPTLPLNNVKSSKPKKQQQQAQSIPLENTKPNKKDKKKQNSKKENVVDSFNLNGEKDKKLLKESYASVNVNSAPFVEDGKKIKTVETSNGPIVIDNDKNGGTGDFNFAAEDYPPLSARSENCLPSKKTPNGSVPPGFKPRPACDGMTFTNSAGQTFPAPPHAYIPPPDFENRNRALVKKFTVALGSAVDEFKVASRAFRDSSIGAEEFHAHCRSALGEQFDAVFPELVALLPDIGKQQELALGRGAGELSVCATCGQLLAPQDRAVHRQAHWPPLAPAPR